MHSTGATAMASLTGIVIMKLYTEGKQTYDMKKILFLIDFADSLENCERVGSLPRNIAQFNALANKCLEIRIVGPDTRDYSARLGKGVYHYPLPSCLKFARVVVFFLLSPFLFRRVFKNCDLYRAKFSSMIPAIIAKKIYKKPIINYFDYNWSELSKESNEKIFEYLAKKFTEKLMIEHSDYFITTTHTLKAYLLKKGFSPEERIYVLPNHVDTQLFNLTQSKMESQDTKILSVGRLNEQKNFPLLIDAGAVLHNKENCKIKLTIVGSGSLKKYLLDLAKEKGVDLTIIDRVENSEMPAIYNGHHIFVMTSPREGHPRALLEAMSCGLPVIGTDVKGIKDIIKDGQNGLLCAQNKQDVADKIFQVICDQNTALRLGKNARMDVIQNYSFQTLIQKEVELYKSV